VRGGDGTLELLVVRVGRERFGLPLAAVEEAVDEPALERLPGAPSAIAGALRWRGTVLTVVAPEPALRVAATVGRAVVVLRGTPRPSALLVDDVLDVMTVPAAAVRPVPGVEEGDGVVLGVCRDGAALVAVLDDTPLRAALGAATDQAEAR
jgi:purine-binding chemotaxis protein CheW